jgi:hypothetical protein
MYFPGKLFKPTLASALLYLRMKIHKIRTKS